MQKNTPPAMNSVAVVLNCPKYPENIGSAVRAAYNMGINDVVVVGADKPDMSLVRKTATHNATSVVDSIRYAVDLDEALADFSLVVGTTARKGRQRQANILPRNLAVELMPWMRRKGKVALLFGAENTGLTNEDLKYCALLTTIPTADFSSLNLAQSVAIICYEVFLGMLEPSGGSEKFIQQSRPATIAERLPMYEAIEEVLRHLDDSSVQGKAGLRSYHLRRVIDRNKLSAKEVVLFKELCHHVLKSIR